jgi:hypothetical protein
MLSPVKLASLKTAEQGSQGSNYLLIGHSVENHLKLKHD